MLYTLGNVNVRDNTTFTIRNPEPDPVTNKRSQELYDALSDVFEIKGWACGRYGQHAYSPELGRDYARFISDELMKADNLKIDFSVQMAGHPIIHHPYPFFIIADYIPFFDLSIMDTIAFPFVRKGYVGDQDFLYKEATGVITYTPVQRYMLINWLGLNPGKVTSICSGVKGFAEPTFHKKNNKKILWVGSDLKSKGGVEVIEALKWLRLEDPEYTLTMVGINDEIHEEGVTVLPFLHGNDIEILDKLYSEAAVFVMPSYKENLGLVYLEAMAHKTPVVVTSRGGIAELIRRTSSGKVVVPGNIAAIVRSIKEITDEDAYEGYSERAYCFARKNAAWDIAAVRMADAIERWLKDIPVVDDYNDYFIDEQCQYYPGTVYEGPR
ncbi:MAG: glycosyltransferase family 4 protein [Lachnospiraceae bacterium]|nr:glycosyltransferase family 4 protein [Lachnospiraceae bacterium]